MQTLGLVRILLKLRFFVKVDCKKWLTAYKKNYLQQDGSTYEVTNNKESENSLTRKFHHASRNQQSRITLAEIYAEGLSEIS